MARKFKSFEERPKPRKRPRRHKKNLNKHQEKEKADIVKDLIKIQIILKEKNTEDRVDNGNSITDRCTDTFTNTTN